MAETYLGEELYNLLADLLNRRMNRTVLDSIRGEYGVLRHLATVEDGATAGTLSEQLHVVPGRMTDILNSLEAKQWIERRQDDEDRRRVKVYITRKGLGKAESVRATIRKEYEGMFQILGQEDTEELIRLLRIVLAYHGKDEE